MTDNNGKQHSETPENANFLIGERKLESATEDAFGHEAHVNSLKKIVAEVKPPWHIALYGTWGAGKSSIVNLLYQRIRADQADENQYNDANESERDKGPKITNTLCVSFNAWKHAEDSLRTELLLDLNQSLQEELNRRFDQKPSQSGNKTPQDESSNDERLTLQSRNEGILSSNKLINELYDVQEKQTKTTKPLLKAISETDNLFLVGIGFLILFAAVIGGIEFTGNPIPLSGGSLAMIEGLGTIFVLLGVGKALFSSFIEEIRDNRKNIHRKLANPQNEWSGAYENIFNVIIDSAAKEYSKRHPEKNAELQRIIITIDDIDRCQSQTAVDILIALKSFLSHEMCVYIIPCDEDALYDHLEAADQGDYLTETSNQQNFLAKFFETEIEIPTPSEQRLAQYFEGRKDQYDRSFDRRSLEVLQQASLDTPRRVTRALNRLVVLEELAENRGVLSINVVNKASSPDKIQDSTDKNHDQTVDDTPKFDPPRAFLAVISVLQTDYPRFHAALENDPELLNELYEQLEGGFASEDRQGLDPLFESMEIPENRRDTLVSFLNQTRDIADLIESPDPFLRLTGSSPNPVVQFKSRFDRGRVNAARTLIEKIKTESSKRDSESTDRNVKELDEMTEYIIQKLSEEAAQVDAFRTAVLIAGAFDTTRKEKVGEATLSALRENRPQDLFTGMELSAFESLMDALPPDRTRELLKLYVESIIDEEGLRTENFRSVINGPGELLESPEVQDAFAERIHSARRRGYISENKFGSILSDIREQKPELYTPKLVRSK